MNIRYAVKYFTDDSRELKTRFFSSMDDASLFADQVEDSANLHSIALYEGSTYIRVIEHGIAFNWPRDGFPDYHFS